MRFFQSKSNTSSVPRRREVSVETRQSNDVNRSYVRNRTLIGSRSALFGSAVEHNADIQSPRAEAHVLAEKRRKIAKVLLIVLLSAVSIFVLLWYFIAGFTLKANDNIVIKDEEPYERVINEYFARQPMERFRFGLNETKLSSFVAAQLPEVESVTLGGVSGIATSQLRLEMRKPVAQWNLGGVDSYVDTDGVSFKTNYYQIPNIQVIDNSGIGPDVAIAVASSRFLSFVGRVVSSSAQSGYKLNSVIIPFGTTRQVEVRLDGVAYPIKLSVDRPVGEQIEDMSRAVSYLKNNNQSPQYIDVRVSGRAYYK